MTMMQKLKKYKSKNKQSFIRNSKRHIVPLLALFVGLLILLVLGNPLWRNNFFHISLTGIPEAGIKISLYLLFLKFGFNELHIPREIKKGNIAISIFAGLVFIGIANIF